MGNAAGQPTNGFHLLRLTELLLQGATLGDIFGKQLESGAVIAVGHSPPGHPDDGAHSIFPLPFRDEAVKGRSRTKMVG